MLIEGAGKECTMTRTCVSILDDHQNVIDGYVMRLSQVPDIAIGGTAHFGVDLEPMLAHHPTDVLLLDVYVPTSIENANPYPMLHVIPKLLDRWISACW
jgi:DNA-binding NarL/FixJ family response regulator